MNNFYEMKNFYEIYQKYMSMSKETLAELLAAKEMNEIEKERIVPAAPIDTLRGTYCCKDFNDCTNPYRDCIGCPLISITGGFTSMSSNIKDNIRDNDFINKFKKMTDD